MHFPDYAGPDKWSDLYRRLVGCLHQLYTLIQSSFNQYGLVIKKFVFSHSLGRAFIPAPRYHGFSHSFYGVGFLPVEG